MAIESIEKAQAVLNVPGTDSYATHHMRWCGLSSLDGNVTTTRCRLDAGRGRIISSRLGPPNPVVPSIDLAPPSTNARNALDSSAEQLAKESLKAFHMSLECPEMLPI